MLQLLRGLYRAGLGAWLLLLLLQRVRLEGVWVRWLLNPSALASAAPRAASAFRCHWLCGAWRLLHVRLHPSRLCSGSIPGPRRSRRLHCRPRSAGAARLAGGMVQHPGQVPGVRLPGLALCRRLPPRAGPSRCRGPALCPWLLTDAMHCCQGLFLLHVFLPVGVPHRPARPGVGHAWGHLRGGWGLWLGCRCRCCCLASLGPQDPAMVLLRPRVQFSWVWVEVWGRVRGRLAYPRP